MILAIIHADGCPGRQNGYFIVLADQHNAERALQG
jgi:hypothetical protein